MFSFITNTTARAALVAAGVGLLAAPAAMATQQKEISHWSQTQSQLQTASRAGGTVQYASQAGDRKYGAAADQAFNATTDKPAFQLASQAGDRKWGAAEDQQSS
jgi:hypothetical protein